LSAEIIELQEKHRALRRELERAHPRFALQEGIRVASATEIAAHLDPDTLLLEYCATDRGMLVFLLDTQGLLGYRCLGAVREIRQTAMQFQGNIHRMLSLRSHAANQMVGAYLTQLLAGAQTLAQSLYDLLLAPLAEKLAQYQRLVIVPDGELYYLPFHAFYNEQTVKYLGETHEVSYAPGAAVLAICAQRPEFPQQGNALIMAYSGGDLTHVLEEARTVTQTIPDSVLFSEHEATRHRLIQLAPQYRVIHLATHGLFRPYNPLFSYLDLADGPLLVRDIYNLDLSAAMVTLGGCESGRGQRKGDDLFGLVRGVIYAGAAAVVSSLWSVDDASSAWVMGAFYRALQAGERKGTALRAAQLALLNRGREREEYRLYTHPAYWAPFCLNGADGPVPAREPRADGGLVG